ncbi:MAG: DUF3299 domain-containing protein [Deltaproteobacteria bacterium]|nr:DUF3299 domain-containing protein [Deltaproteobacteria bacterium]
MMASETTALGPRSRWRVYIKAGLTLIVLLAAASSFLPQTGRPPEQSPVPVAWENPFAAAAPASKPDTRTTPASVEAEKPEPPREVKGYLVTSFPFLSSFDYQPPDPVGEMLAGGAMSRKPESLAPEKPVIPKEIMALSGRKIAIKGFMIPIDLDTRGVRRFALVKNQLACCYGVIPNPNEWIYVVMDDRSRADSLLDQIITVYGTLRISETLTEGGINSLYQMEGERVTGPVD